MGVQSLALGGELLREAAMAEAQRKEDSMNFVKQARKQAAKYRHLEAGCHATPRHTTSCSAMPCHAVPCRAMPCHAVPCRAMPCHAMCAGLCHAMCLSCGAVWRRLGHGQGGTKDDDSDEDDKKQSSAEDEASMLKSSLDYVKAYS